MKAVLARGRWSVARVVQAGDTTIDCGGGRCVRDDPVEFTTRIDLLRYLAERPGLALSRQQILDGVWGYDWFGDARTVDVHIAQVRRSSARGNHHHGPGCRLPPGVVEVRKHHNVTRRTRRLRRLLVAMIAIALGTLAVTAAVTAGLRAARPRTQQHARGPHPIVADELNQLIALLPPRAPPTRRGRSPSDPSHPQPRADHIERVRRGGRRDRCERQRTRVPRRPAGVDDGDIALPNGVSADDLDVTAFRRARRRRDATGIPSSRPSHQHDQRAHASVVLADQVSSRPFGDSSGAVLAAAILALVVAALIAAYLARRMTRPLAAMETTAGRIAAGDLSGRSTRSTLPTTSSAAWPRRSTRWPRSSTLLAATSGHFS